MEHRDRAAQRPSLLGKYVRVRVTRPLGSVWEGVRYEVNYGELFGLSLAGAQPLAGVFILGIHHPVRFFDGRAIALAFTTAGLCYAVCAPKKKRFIVGQVRRALHFVPALADCRLVCLYEHSCGAVVFHRAPQGLRFLLIKNRCSANWGYAKGHVENNETAEQTARREVFEEIGLHVRLLPGFACQSDYVIQGRIEKSVTIFLAEAASTHTVMQEEEIENFCWVRYAEAMRILKFENDRATMRKAFAFLRRQEAAEKKRQDETTNPKNPGIK
ncbi:MAG: NUDIX domain-containing protein [Oscillospiraceae bacterium]|jgi:8-oxo-dGTP pyrophosphatase MutT (NUDIX family)|nr:NUDIX domain-containing protein [Oscillospiraceae bacterium]